MAPMDAMEYRGKMESQGGKDCRAEMVLQDRKETKAKKDTEESKALGALQATQ